METTTIWISSLILSNNSPTRTALVLLIVSILTSVILMNHINISLVGWIIILTFSSGMMVVVIYTSNSTPNENENSHSSIYILPIMTLVHQNNNTNYHSTNMVWFSSGPQIIIIATILTITIMTVIENCFNPTSATNTSF